MKGWEKLFRKIKTKSMKTEECGLFTRGWETGLPKNKRAWIKEKKDSQIQWNLGRNFMQKALLCKTQVLSVVRILCLEFRPKPIISL